MIKVVFAVIMSLVITWMMAGVLRQTGQPGFTMPVFLVILFPLLSYVFLIYALLDLRRRRSLHQVTVDGEIAWVWIGLDGRPQCAKTDPTPDWDSADADSGD